MGVMGTQAYIPARMALFARLGWRRQAAGRGFFSLFAVGGSVIASVGSPALASNGLADGGFDSQGSGVSTYCYMGSSGCPTGAWSGNSTALVNSGNVSWGAPAAQSPSTLVALQGQASLTQTFTATSSGGFRVVWYEADRPNLGGQTFNVLINGTVVATSSPSGTALVRKTSSSIFSMAAGQSYTISFQGTSNSGDHSAFIESVDILTSSDSATYSYDALGRLTAVSHSGAINNGLTASYALDPADNRSNVTVSGAGH